MTTNSFIWDSLTDKQRAIVADLCAGGGIIKTPENADDLTRLEQSQYVKLEFQTPSGRIYVRTEAACHTVASLYAALQAENAALADRVRALEGALKPFAQDLTEWKQYVESGGEMPIIDFFTDYLDDQVLLANLERARAALEGAE